MSDRIEFSEEDSRRLIVAITDFLRDQLNTREDLLPEDRDCLEIAIQCLEMAYGLDPNGYVQLRFSRPLLDIFSQVTNPVTVRDKLRADAHKDEGNDYMRRNMYQNAESEYTAAIELDRWNSIYYCNRAGARIEQQNFFDAIADCRQALMLNPDYAKAYGRMGQAYALLNRPREAARCFRQALQLDPRNERYRNNLGVAERQLNRPDVLGIFSGVLGSIFGSGPQTSPILSSGTRIPPSFMIFAERPIPARETPQRSTQPAQNDGKITRTERNVPECSLHNLGFPRSLGAIDSNSTRSSAVQVDPAADTEINEEVEGEIVIEVPGYSFFPDVVPVNRPHESGYSFSSKDNEPGKIIHSATCPEKDKITPLDNDNKVDGSLEMEKSKPKIEEDAESTELSGPKNIQNIATDTPKSQDAVLDRISSHIANIYDKKADGSLEMEKSQLKIEEGAESSKLSGPENIQNIATDTPKAQDSLFDRISSHTIDKSLEMKSSQPKLKKDEENCKLSSPESNKNLSTDKSKTQDTTDEEPFVVSWPANEEWNKFKEDDKKSIVASTSNTKFPTSNNNADINNSDILKPDAGTVKEVEDSGQSEIQMLCPKKMIRSESELFETIQSHQGFNINESKEKTDVKTNVTQNESSDKSDDSN